MILIVLVALMLPFAVKAQISFKKTVAFADNSSEKVGKDFLYTKDVQGFTTEYDKTSTFLMVPTVTAKNTELPTLTSLTSLTSIDPITQQKYDLQRNMELIMNKLRSEPTYEIVGLAQIHL